MYDIVRVGAFSTAILALAACSASQSANSSLAPNMPAAVHAPAHLGHHHFKPNDIIGGSPGIVIKAGDVALPNGSGIKAINVGIDKIMVADAYGNVTTIAQYSTPEVINIMAYQGGNTTPIGQGNVDPTTFASMTIVVDTASSAVIGSSSTAHPLNFLNEATKSTSGFGSTTTTAPYGPGQVAITFDRAFQVGGSSVTLDVDFNVMESILPGSTEYARPSLSVAQEGFEGSIAGNLQNASGGVVSNAVLVATANDGSIVATGFTDSNGNFLLHTMVAGAYQLTIYNAYVSAAGWAINATNETTNGSTVRGPSATVTPGQTTQVGTIAD